LIEGNKGVDKNVPDAFPEMKGFALPSKKDLFSLEK
jgi:hypothetical protein